MVSEADRKRGKFDLLITGNKQMITNQIVHHVNHLITKHNEPIERKTKQWRLCAAMNRWTPWTHGGHFGHVHAIRKYENTSYDKNEPGVVNIAHLIILI